MAISLLFILHENELRGIRGSKQQGNLFNTKNISSPYNVIIDLVTD
jgi:hypothetical protein